MKTLFSFVVGLFFVASATAQTTNLPQAVSDHFNTELPGTYVHWTQNNNQHLGQFKNNGKPAGMRYELDGTFVRKETKVQMSDLPQALLTHLVDNNLEASVVSIFMLETTTTTYLINIGGTNHMYDATGSLMGTSNTQAFTW